MKKSKLTGHVAGYIWSISVVFVFSMIMGVFTISIGIGSLIPPLNLLAKPFVCPNGQMGYTEHSSSRVLGTTYTQLTWLCTDARTGAQTQLDIFSVGLFTGLIFGLPLFVLLWLVAYRSYKRDGYWWFDKDQAVLERVQGALHEDGAPHYLRGQRPSPAPEEDSASRMDALQRLRDRKLITDAEYEKKRGEILKDL